MKRFLYLALLSVLFTGTLRAQLAASVVKEFFAKNPAYLSDGFDYPVGPPHATKYYNAQGFGKNYHLGDDWNGTGGGNTDLGDPVYACANGLVTYAQDAGPGWGNVVRVVHVISTSPLVWVESLYAHLNEINTKQGQPVKRGTQIGTIGTANGTYYAHLHFEIRTEYGMPVGGGYSEVTTGYTNPTAYIKAHRPKR